MGSGDCEILKIFLFSCLSCVKNTLYSMSVWGELALHLVGAVYQWLFCFPKGMMCDILVDNFRDTWYASKDK